MDANIYFYRKDNELGYDQISVVAYTERQANEVIKGLVIVPEEFHLHHSVVMNDYDYAQELDDSEID